MMAEEFIRRVREKLPSTCQAFERDRDAQDMVLIFNKEFTA